MMAERGGSRKENGSALLRRSRNTQRNANSVSVWPMRVTTYSHKLNYFTKFKTHVNSQDKQIPSHIFDMKQSETLHIVLIEF